LYEASNEDAMSDRQRENIAKYLYDISKGVALLSVVNGLVTGQASAVNVSLGVLGAIIFLMCGYWIDGGRHESG
jgi:hypothetical protein